MMLTSSQTDINALKLSAEDIISRPGLSTIQIGKRLALACWGIECPQTSDYTTTGTCIEIRRVNSFIAGTWMRALLMNLLH